MNRLIIIFLLSLSSFAQTGGGAVLGGGAHTSNVGSGAAGGITAGDAIICSMQIAGGGAFSSLADSLNGTFTSVAACTNQSSSSIGCLYYFPNSAHGSSDTITLTISSGAAGMSCEAFKNVKTSAAVDASATWTAPLTQTNYTTAAFATTTDGDLLYGFLGVAASVVTAGACTNCGAATIIDANSRSIFLWPEYGIQSTHSASTTISWTNASSLGSYLYGAFLSNGGTISLDGTCNALATGGPGITTLVVTISC